MLPFRPVLCCPHIYQSAEASNDTASAMAGQDNVYIDDMLILAEIPEQASQHLKTLLFILQALEFIVNQDKSVFTPAQQIKFLGLVVNLVSMACNYMWQITGSIVGKSQSIICYK